MRVEQLGEGDPEVAVVGGIHGDEPCGPRAVDALLADPPAVQRPVKLVVANEEAIERNSRYVDVDLNRAFPGDPEGEAHEERLAHRLRTELRGCTTFSLHSTQSYPVPFVLVAEVDALVESVVPYLTVESVVETGEFSKGRLIETPEVVEVECGLQGSAAAAHNAELLARQFLAAVGATTARRVAEEREVPVFRLARALPKDRGASYEVFARNFERVDAGDAYAAADGVPISSEEPFYPVLLSPYGYEDVFGYAASLVGRLGEVAPEPSASETSL